MNDIEKNESDPFVCCKPPTLIERIDKLEKVLIANTPEGATEQWLFQALTVELIPVVRALLDHAGISDVESPGR